MSERLTKEEVERRIERLKGRLQELKLHGALITTPLNIFYFTGTFVMGHLLLTPAEVKLFVFRPISRAKRESFVSAEPLRSLKKLPSLLRSFGIKRLGLEFEGLTHQRFLVYREILEEFELVDISGPIRKVRELKSDYEMFCLKRAAELLDEAFYEALPSIREGTSELEALSLVESALRKRGHPGFVRSARGNEFPTGVLSSGPFSVEPSYMISGEGGRGVEGFPLGASKEPLSAGTPIVCDFSGFFKGYYVDETRMLFLKEAPKPCRELLEASLRIMKAMERVLVPGVAAEDVYAEGLAEAERLGVSKYFMAHGEEGVSFVGHGVGLCIDEDPPIAPGVKTRLLPGMAVALEPKLHIPELGVIGIEDTFLIKRNYTERITNYPREVAVF